MRRMTALRRVGGDPAGQRRGAAGACGAAAGARRAVPQQHELRALARGFQAGGGGARRLAPAWPTRRWPGVTFDPGDRQPRTAARACSSRASCNSPAAWPMAIGCGTGAAKLKQHAADAGPRRAAVRRAGARSIVAFWALETDFGANNGNLPVLRSLLTLAYDCRRPDMFREELIYALKVVQRGDLDAGADDRRLGRRDRPDPVLAVGLFQVRGRFRRRRPAPTSSTARPT